MRLPRCHGPLLRGLNLPWAKALGGGVTREYGTGEIFHQMGDRVDALHYVLEGHVVAKAVTPEGVERYVLGFLPGTIFGQSPFFNRAPAETLFVSVGHTVAVALGRDYIYGEVAQRHPSLLLNLLESDAYRHRVFGRHIADATLRDLETRLCRFILHLVTEASDPVPVEQALTDAAAEVHPRTGDEGAEGPADCPARCHSCASALFSHPGLTHEDVARYLGLHRVTVSNLLGGLRRAGVLGQFNRKVIEVCDGAELVARAGMSGDGDRWP